MIRGLRRRHRLIWVVLFPVVALILAVALLSRPEPPLMDEIPAARPVAAETVGGTEDPQQEDEDP
jgi:hypothetical protein